jgi:protein-tyrosine phosphatase
MAALSKNIVSEHMTTQHIPLEGQPNFRDLGGYQTADGRTVKSGLVYRAGELGGLTDEDIARLQELGIKSVVDFRSGSEVAWRGEDRLPEGAAYVALPIEPGNLGPALGNAIENPEALQVSGELLSDTNRAVIREATDQMSALFEMFADPSNLPLVMHCTHGKDRTGVSSAVVLMALGVPAETAKADYLKSNVYRGEANEEQLAELRQLIAADNGIDPSMIDLSSLRSLFYVDPSYFEAMLDEIDQQYGSFESYLEDGLGIDPSRLAYLQQLFTD